MAISNFQPTIWSAVILDTLKKSLVFGAPGVVNRDYEGEITGGGTSVKITDFADPTIGTFVKDTDITVQALTDATRSLLIDQQKYFAFEVDDLDAVQSRNGGAIVTQAGQQAAYKLRDVADSVISAEMKANALAGNKLGAKAVSTSDLAFKLLVDFRTKLAQNNVPEEGRWAILPPTLYAYLLQDARFISAANSGSTDPLLNGRVGRALGLTVYESNNCAAGATTGTMAYAGHAIGTSYAEQIVKVEAARMEKRFADMLKGLHVYGCRVIRAEAVVTADVTVS
jgi:N4-gp56 family major capsid protein